jgi:hypothetical protein
VGLLVLDEDDAEAGRGESAPGDLDEESGTAGVTPISARERAVPWKAGEAALRAGAGVVTAGVVRCRT